MTIRLTVFLLALATCACGSGREDFRDCSTVDISGAEALPARLSETGLYSDIASGVVNPSAIEFEPRFPLWTDSAAKRRWLLLPEGERVDSQAGENWVFPVGTRLFKEFTRDGVRVETRMNRRDSDGWAAAAYIWTEDGSDAVLQLNTVENASGTAHDVPGAAECQACHGGRGNFTLGFSATQLDVASRVALYDGGVLSHPVPTELDLDPAVETGLGYLHGNCSHCHNASRDEQPQASDCYSVYENFDLTLPPDLDDVELAPALETARRLLGKPGDSKVLDRMSDRNQSDRRPSMPPLGTELVDPTGIAAVEAFIAEIPQDGR